MVRDQPSDGSGHGYRDDSVRAGDVHRDKPRGPAPQSLSRKISAHDLIGALTIIGCFVMIGMGANGSVQTTLAVVIGFFFGRKTLE